MTISPPAVLLGVQQPRVMHRPSDVLSSSGAEAVELAASAGLILDPWQAMALDLALSERKDGQWAAFEVGLVVGRQNGKGSLIEARELAGLFLFGERLILHTAHIFNTSWEAFLRICQLIESTPDLDRKVRQIRKSHVDVSIELKSGQRLRFIARNKGSGRGFSGDCVILDEAMYVDSAAVGALLPTLSARPNPQVWYTGSAPFATSTQLHALRRRALGGEADRLAYMEWSIDPEVDDPDDPSAWAKANPALGIRIPVEFVRAEREALPPGEFARERLGVPDVEPADSGAVVPLEVWRSLADPNSEWAGTPVGVADVSPDGRCSVVLAGVRADGLRHVELVDNRAGTGWVAARRAELSERYGVTVWVRDPSGPAVELDGDWLDLTSRQYAEACAGFVRAAVDPDAPEGERFHWTYSDDLERAVMAALRGAVRRQRGDGGAVWGRKQSGVDISPVVAMSLGWWAAGASPPSGDPLLSVW